MPDGDTAYWRAMQYVAAIDIANKIRGIPLEFCGAQPEVKQAFEQLRDWFREHDQEEP